MRAAISGVTRIACATTIAAGVNSRPSGPNGPERESKRYTTRPTTTAGRPMKAFSTATTTWRPGKEPVATSAPNGKPNRHPAATAVGARLAPAT